ncbi:hypothetical protein N7466_002988 [Penicillium verhagenii]|uniref:uncharacterized protein n=1 Tax=Penicillium verhagenii TaxID=1562060 RepID=UPI002545BC15|nr:uncharacterized protein N7466_002988 [Penicillium verhagenii]KAJ5936538.1 hypothetical protein N7466_002988 [Penicillium verhagenii]
MSEFVSKTEVVTDPDASSIPYCSMANTTHVSFGIIQGYLESDWTGGKIATNSTDIGDIPRVGVLNMPRIPSDG